MRLTMSGSVFSALRGRHLSGVIEVERVDSRTALRDPFPRSSLPYPPYPDADLSTITLTSLFLFGDRRRLGNRLDSHLSLATASPWF
jgi:hypothetical protein